MPLRPADTDLLGEIAISIARENYGFLYVDRVSEEIRDRYESEDTGLTKASSLSRSDIKESLQEIAGQEHEDFRRIRSGVYYYDPFSTGHDNRIPNRLKDLFLSTQQVVTAEQIRNEFNLAVDDVEFFVDKLVSNDMLFRIAAGSREYYSVGSLLKEQTGQNRLEDELREQSRGSEPLGILSHDELEQIISVNATTDVIRYLEGQLGFLADLDGEYLVWGALEDYGRWMAEEIADDVISEFDDVGHAMPTSEYREVVTARIEGRTDILENVSRSERDDVIDAVEEGLQAVVDIDVDGRIAVHRAPLSEEIDAHAEKIVSPLLADTAAATPSVMKEEAETEIEDLRLADSEEANRYLREQVRERANGKIEEAF
ncbi:hypothetical protein [Halopenitus persicus]|uniref:hypothetical protein n=1 Tax=Halopenitus persicus TaxID=1048396 RepID=UPI000BBA857F|nr:hypothetical protein [Halopenitus persicus]